MTAAHDADGDLIAAWIDGEISAEDGARLARRLDADDALRQRLAGALATDHALRRLHGSSATGDEFLIALCAHLPRRRSHRFPIAWRWLAAAGIAAAAALVLTLVLAAPAAPTPRLIDAAQVEPSVRGDGRLADGSRVSTGPAPARIRIGDHATLTVRPYTVLRLRDSQGRLDDWLVEHGAVTFDGDAHRIEPLTIGTPQARARITGTILHVTTSGIASSFAVERGSISLADAGGRQGAITTGQAMHCRRDGTWVPAACPPTPARMLQDALYDEDVALWYQVHGPVLATLRSAGIGSPRSLDRAWLRSAVVAERDLAPTIGDDGTIACPAGSGSLRIGLPRLDAAGIRLRFEARLRGQGISSLSTELFPQITMPSPPMAVPDGQPLDVGSLQGRWVAVEMRAVRVGVTLAGTPVWETCCAVGPTVLYDWSSGDWPQVTWHLNHAGIELRHIDVQGIERPRLVP